MTKRPATFRAAAYRFALATAWLWTSAACIEQPEAPAAAEPACRVDNDCDMAHGEVCEQGICWGQPDAHTFAAVLLPDSDGAQPYAATEIPRLTISTGGRIEELVIEEARTIRGRVLLSCAAQGMPDDCDVQRPVAASIDVRRPSRILGGLSYMRSTTSEAAAPNSGPNFTLHLPSNIAGEAYDITIHPLDAAAEPTSSDSAVALVPPMRFALEVQGDMNDVEWVLGQASKVRLLKGRIVDAVGDGIAAMRIFASAQSNNLPTSDRQSSIAVSDQDGFFQLWVSRQEPLRTSIDLEIHPQVEGSTPTLFISGADIADANTANDGGEADASGQLGKFRMPSYGDVQTFQLPITGIDGNGEVVPVRGASVEFSTELRTDDERIRAEFRRQHFTDVDGIATVELIPGSEIENRRYFVQALSPADSIHASVYQHRIDVGSQQGGVLAPLSLAARVPVTGRLLDAEGNPVADATVSASLAQTFRWNIAPEPRLRADQLPQPTSSTDLNGSFVLWLDREIYELPAVYDLEMLPAGLALPAWSWDAIDIAASSRDGAVELGDLPLPRTALVRGEVLTSSGMPMPGVDVRIYQVTDMSEETASDLDACRGWSWPQSDGSEPGGENGYDVCQVPVRYRARAVSDENGEIVVSLPNADP